MIFTFTLDIKNNSIMHFWIKISTDKEELMLILFSVDKDLQELKSALAKKEKKKGNDCFLTQY